MAGVDVGGGNGESFSLNLYPMLDVFSILIIFLVMNFSASGESVETKLNLELPKSAVKMSLDSAANVSISKTEILVQGGLSIPIEADGDVAVQYRDQGAIRTVYEEFKKVSAQNETLKNRNKALNLSDSDINTLVLEADKQVQFKVLKRVMLSAQQADFIAWKLAVSKLTVD
jgi:biopolymer transport protein ExbD